MQEEAKIANSFNLIPELGPIRLARLKAEFENYRAAWKASYGDLTRALGEKVASAVCRQRDGIDPESEWKRLEKAGITVLLMDDPLFPPQLKEIPAPPPLLYIRGEARFLSRLSVAVVGTRKMTLYGKQAVREITDGLAAAGLVIVSGLAFGIDAEALKTALEAGASCVAVLASPIDDGSISPRSNFQLGLEITKTGCLVSEYPLGSSVQKQNFPVRNRIISGLSAGTLVAEADEDSGSLITARYALDQNRLVFAVPGSIFSPVSRGTNGLIRQGAVPVRSASDILTELNLDITQPIADYELTTNPDESLMLEQIGREPISADEIIRQTRITAGQVNALLAMLELKGLIKNLGGNKYVKTR